MPTFHILAETEVATKNTLDMLIEAENADDARERARLFLSTYPHAAAVAAPSRLLPLKTRYDVPTSIRIKKVQEVVAE